MRRPICILPCDPTTGKRLLDHLAEHVDGCVDVLALEKQRAALGPLLAEHAVTGDVTWIDEPFYGARSPASVATLTALVADGPRPTCWFPLSVFDGNAWVLGAYLAESVRRVPVNHLGHGGAVLERSRAELAAALPGTVVLRTAAEADGYLDRARETFAPHAETLRATFPRPHGRSDTGLLSGFPAQVERAALYRALAQSSEGGLLELACGSGLGASLLTDHPGYLGLDRDHTAVALGREIVGHARFATADARRLPCASASIDTCLALELIEHLDEPLALLTEVARVLRPGGSVALSTPVAERFPWRVPGTDVRAASNDAELLEAGWFPWHALAFDPPGLTGMLADAGLAETEITYPAWRLGPELAASAAVGDARALASCVDWRLSDFELRTESSETFGGASFVARARRPAA